MEIMTKSEEKDEKRDSWGNAVEFTLALLGNAVGPGNLLRFPYMTFRNGGGAFLIPYFFWLFVCGLPLYFIELFIGQRSQKSCVACWDVFCPIMKGCGVTMALMGLMFVLIYQAAAAWTLYYMAASLTTTLPWTSCNQTWNTPNCVLTILDGNVTYSNETAYYNKTGLANLTDNPMSAAEEYWQYHVLRMSAGIHDIGIPNWRLCVSHLVSSIVIYLCLVKGVRSVGKVVWVTATVPYILIIIFLIRTVFLPGSWDGIKFYLTPDMDVLLSANVWCLAFLQIFYTLGIAFGPLMTMSSFNKVRYNYLRETVIVPIATCMASFISGFVIFGCVGYLAHMSGVGIEQAISAGPGLAFVTYPELVSHLPGGPLWSFLFFFMLFTIVLDTMFVAIEVLVSGIVDEFKLPKRQSHVILAGVMIVNFFFGVLMVTNAGMYLFQLLDWYYSILGMFLAASLELLVMSWLYGYDRIYDDVEIMTGRRPLKWLLVPLLAGIIPVLLLAAMVWSLCSLTRPVYGSYEYPDWSVACGYALAVALALPTIICPIFQIARGKEDVQTRLKRLVKPDVPPIDLEENGNDPASVALTML